MSSSCDTAQTTSPPAVCPVTGRAGVPVQRRTVQSLLTCEALQRIGTGPYFFCSARSCDVVYFNRDGEVFTQDAVRVPVSQKARHGTRSLCYCFGEDEADIRREVVEAGSTLAVERVRAHIAAGRCACDVRNPSGRCCLADLLLLVRQLHDDRSR